MEIRQSRSAVSLERLSRAVTLTAFALAFIVAIAAPLLALSWGHQPFPGFMVEQTLVVVGSEHWEGHPAGPAHPERVVRIGDVAVTTSAEFNAVLAAHAVGDSLSLLTESPQGSDHLYRSVTLAAFPAADMVRLFWLSYLVGLIYLGIGVWIYLARGQTRPGRALAFFAVSTSVVCMLIFDLSTTHIFFFIWTAAIAQIGGALISLALRFPVEWKPVERRAWLLVLPYVVSIGLAVWGVWVVNDTEHPWAYIAAWGASYRYTALAVLAFLGIMFYRARRGESMMVRRQARVVLLGSAAAFTPISVWFAAPLFNLAPAFDEVLFLPGLVLFPLAVAVAILRYRLPEADTLVNRTLVYGTLTAILGGAFTAGIALFQKLFIAFTGEKSDAAFVITMLILASAFAPLRNRLQGLVDARFKQAPDNTRDLKQFGEQVRAFTRMSEPEQLIGRLLEEARASLRAESGAVSLVADGRLQTVHSSGRWAGEAWLSVPLEYGGARYGMLFLGPSRDRQPYSRDDFEVLRQVALEVARALRLDMAKCPDLAPQGTAEHRHGRPARGPSPEAA